VAGYSIKSWIVSERVAKAVTALGDDRALKFYEDSDKGQADYKNEKDMLLKLKSSASEWVVNLLEALESPYVLAFELLGESLAQWLDKVERDKYFSQTTELVSVQILAAVNALHASRIIHCDLKPEQFCFRLGLPTGQVHSPSSFLLLSFFLQRVS
jgi:serine/threonine protein kinase